MVLFTVCPLSTRAGPPTTSSWKPAAAGAGLPSSLPAQPASASRPAARTGCACSPHLHQVHVMSPVAIGDERDLLAVGRPGGEVVLGPVPRQVAQAGAVGVHDVD